MNCTNFKIEIDSSIYKLPGQIGSYQQLLEQIRISFGHRITSTFEIFYFDGNSKKELIQSQEGFATLLTKAGPIRTIKLQIQMVNLSEKSHFNKEDSFHLTAISTNDFEYNWCQLLDELDSEDCLQGQLFGNFISDSELTHELFASHILGMETYKKNTAQTLSFDLNEHSDLQNSVEVLSDQRNEPSEPIGMPIDSVINNIPPSNNMKDTPNQKPESIISLDESTIVFIRSENISISSNNNNLPEEKKVSPNEEPQFLIDSNATTCTMHQKGSQSTQQSPDQFLLENLKDVNYSDQQSFIKEQNLEQTKEDSQNKGAVDKSSLDYPLLALSTSKQNQPRPSYIIHQSFQPSFSNSKDINPIKLPNIDISQPLPSASYCDSNGSNQINLTKILPSLTINDQSISAMRKRAGTEDINSQNPHGKLFNSQLGESQSNGSSLISQDSSTTTSQNSFLQAGLKFLNKLIDFPQHKLEKKQTLFSSSRQGNLSQAIPPNTEILFHSQGNQNVHRSSLQTEKPVQQQQFRFSAPTNNSNQNKPPCILIGYYTAKVLNSPENVVFIHPNQFFTCFFQFENKGKEKWPQNVKFRCIEGVYEDTTFPIDPAEPSGISSLYASFVSPTLSDKYMVAFKLCYVNNDCELKYFGPKITFQIIVKQQN